MPVTFIPATYKEYTPGQKPDEFALVEAQIANLVVTHPMQGRKGMVLHPILGVAARMKCLDMAARGYGEHVDPDGHGPNWLVRNLGYLLPSFYGTDADDNNIE